MTIRLIASLRVGPVIGPGSSMEADLQEKFNMIYISHFPKMRNFAMSLCGNRDDAEDLAQEAFVRAFKGFEKCDNPDRLDNWLMRIVYRTFIDSRRAAHRRPRIQDGESKLEEEVADGNSKSPELILMEHQIDKDILEAIQLLDHTSQKMIYLVYIEERSPIEICESFGLNTQALRSRLFRLCNRLRRELESKFATTIEANSEPIRSDSFRRLRAPLRGVRKQSSMVAMC